MLKVPDKYIVGGHKKQFIMERSTLDFEMNLPLDLKLKETLNLIEAGLKYYMYVDTDGLTKSACFVSSSRGKDSGILEYLIKKVCDDLKIPMIPILLSNTLNLFPEEINYWKLFNKRYNLTDAFHSFLPPKDEDGNQITVHTIREKNQQMENFRNKSQKVWNEKTQRFNKSTEPNCCYILKFRSVNEFLESDAGKHLKCSFDGRRAEENNNRSRLILQHCRSFESGHKRPRKFRNILPMGMWRDTDIEEFAKQNFIPICPSYKIHNLQRMGCRNCVAYKSWIISQCSDPTGLRTNDLIKNLADMEKFDAERLKTDLIYSIKKLKSKKTIVDPKALQILDNYALKYNLLKKSLLKCNIPTFILT